MNRTLIQSILTIVVACSTSLGLWASKKPYVIRNHEFSSKVLEIRDYVTSKGGRVVDLTPEKDLIVWLPDTFDPSQSSYTIVPYSVGLAPYYQSRGSSTRHAEPFPTLSREEFAELWEKHGANRSSATRSPAVEPNALSQCRAMLRGEVNRPSFADNSLSKYFPPITNQIGGSCVNQAWVYYARTYFNSTINDVSVSHGELTSIYNPYFSFMPAIKGESGNGHATGVPYSFYRNEFDFTALSKMQPSVYENLLPSDQAKRKALDDVVIDYELMENVYDHDTKQYLYTDDELRKIKQLLANGEILALGVEIEQWLAAVSSGPVVYKLTNPDGYGGHVMTLVGYDDNKAYTLDNGTVKKGAFLVANSWGKQWGKSNSLGIHKGYVWIAYDLFKTNIGDSARYRQKRDINKKARYYLRLVMDLSAQANDAGIGNPITIQAFDEGKNLAWNKSYPFERNFVSPAYSITDYSGYIDITNSLEKVSLENINYRMHLKIPEKDVLGRLVVGSFVIKKIEMYKVDNSNQDACIFADHTVRTLLPGGTPVNVEIKPASDKRVQVAISPLHVGALVNGTQSFTTAVTVAENKDVTWSCTGGTVSADGFYTAPSTPGTTTVTATSVADTTQSATATVTVSSTPITVAINPSSTTVASGDALRFTAIVDGTTNQNVTWSCSGGMVLPNGLYLASGGYGNFTLYATSEADPSMSGSATVKVIAGASGVDTSYEVEPNDSLSTANTVPDKATSVKGSMSNATDEDYFKVSVDAGVTLAVIMHYPYEKDHDLYLYDSSGTLLMKSISDTSTERVSATNNSSSPTTYTIGVKGYNDACTTLSSDLLYSLQLIRFSDDTPNQQVSTCNRDRH